MSVLQGMSEARGRWWEAIVAIVSVVLLGLVLSGVIHPDSHTVKRPPASTPSAQAPRPSHPYFTPHYLSLHMPGWHVVRPSRARPAPARLYRIRWGDTLWGLAQRFHVGVAALKMVNHLPGDTIMAGRLLLIPHVYHVRPGDTLKALAHHWDVSVAALSTLNHLKRPAVVPGQRLVIPPRRPLPRLSAAVPQSTSHPVSTKDPLSSRGAWPNRYHLSARDFYMIARLVQAEAGNQPFRGQVAVAAVVLNRLKSPDFPPTVAGVIFSPGQFETVSTGAYWNRPGRLALLAARAAGTGWDPSGGALYFYNPGLVDSGWMRHLPRTADIAQQVFAR